jgi:hypothetical protein
VRPPVLPLLGLLAAAPSLGCVNTDTAIFVDPQISSPPQATVTSVALGTTLNGTFVLDLHLGLRAGGPSTVTLGQFSIEDLQNNTIVPALTLSDDVPFPATVQPSDSDVVAHFTFSTGNATLPSAVKAQLCSGSMVIIAGSIDDSLAGRSDPFTSPGFTPTCM